MVTKERLEKMQDWFWNETNDPETEEWRENLTEEEAIIVARWDQCFEECYEKMWEDLL